MSSSISSQNACMGTPNFTSDICGYLGIRKYLAKHERSKHLPTKNDRHPIHKIAVTYTVMWPSQRPMYNRTVVCSYVYKPLYR